MRGYLPRGPRGGHGAASPRIEEMRARAVWSRLRYFTPQQRLKAARETRSIRTLAVAQVVLSEACGAARTEPRLAEEWAAFGIQLLELLPSRELSAGQRKERLGEAYTLVGNARRIAADYPGAGAALQAAHDFLKEQRTGHLAHLLSIRASLTYDMGDISGAVELIAQGQQIYSEVRDRLGIARLGVQQANFLREVQPSEARAVADEALLVLPRTELRLEMLARCIISECLAEAHEGHAALAYLEGARPLINQFREVWIDGRVQFLEARILEVLGFIADAERLYAEVARLFWFRELYRESFMVRLRLFEFYLSRNRLREAGEVCRRAVALLEEAGVHAQMREVWRNLFEAVEAQAMKVEMLPLLRGYMVRHWRVPAERPLVFLAAG